MNNSTAFTGSDSERFSPFMYSGILGTIGLAIVVGNVFTVAIFSKRRSGSNHAHIFLINLAAADILVGAISVPMLIYLIGSQNKWWAREPRIVNSIYLANDILAGFASIFSLFCIALERLYAIMFPLKHRLATKRVYHTCVLLIWLTSVLVVTLRFIVENRTFAYLVAIIFGLALLLIFIAYITLWCTVKTHKVSSARRQMETTRERILAKTLIVVTVVFMFTWTPFQVVNLLYTICIQSCCPLPSAVIHATKVLHYGNSMANPILYAFRMKEFRDFFKEMPLCKRYKTKTPVTNQTLSKTGENNFAFEMDTKLQCNDVQRLRALPTILQC